MILKKKKSACLAVCSVYCLASRSVFNGRTKGLVADWLSYYAHLFCCLFTCYFLHTTCL